MFDSGGNGRRSKLPTWQKAAAIVPLALLTGSLTSAVGNATDDPSPDRPEPTISPVVPVVPTTPFEVPASVQLPDSLTGIDPHAGPDGTVSTLAQQGIPTAALLAYQRAAMVLAQADPACRLDWPLIGAIGRVESDHGRANGNVLGADGVSRPGIFGLPLDGSGHTAEIADSDNGVYDQDTVWDRAVGAMQFIPTTWQVVAVDGDDDGTKNPQDIDDSALATAVYLCAGFGDLGTDAGARDAVYRYNHSSEYVDLVLSIAEEYAMGNYSMVPNGTTSPTVLTDVDHDAQQPPGHHGPVVDGPHQQGDNGTDGGGRPDTSSDGPSNNRPSNDGPGNNPPGNDGPSTDPPPGNGGPGGGGGGPGGGVEDLPNGVGDTANDTVKVLDTLAEATRWCQRQLAGKDGISQADIQTCAEAVVGQTVDQAAATLDGLLDTLVGDVVCGVLGCGRR
jgi:transglycosylase-like protein with SLT domain